MESPSPITSETCSSMGNHDSNVSPIKMEHCSLGNGESDASPIKIGNCSLGNGKVDASPIKIGNGSLGNDESSSPKKPRLEETEFWLEDLFVKTPQYTFEICKNKFDKTIDNFYQNNADLVAIIPKEFLIKTLQKLAYHKLILKHDLDACDDAIKDISERMGVVTFNNGEVQFLEEYDHYLAAIFFTTNISEQIQEVHSKNIFEPENCGVKFFINEIAEQNKTGPMYEMWDEFLYFRLFPSAKLDSSEYRVGRSPADFEIQWAKCLIAPAKPECVFQRVKEYLQLCKKHNRLDLIEYESILLTLLNKVVIADLSNEMKEESTHGKLLRYSAFYQSLLLKTIYFGDKCISREENIIISNIRALIERVKLDIDAIFNLCMEWLERDGVYLASCMKVLTESMVSKYMKVFNQLLYNGGFKLIYAERIYTYFLKPILNSIEDEGIPEIKINDFMTLFVSVTQYMYETQQEGITHDQHYSRKVLYLTKNEWKGLRMWLENSEENGDFVRKVFKGYKSNL